VASILLLLIMATALLNFANSVLDYTLPEEEIAKTASVVTGPFKPVQGNARCVDLPVTQGSLVGLYLLYVL
jgi:hypothetical protein